MSTRPCSEGWGGGEGKLGGDNRNTADRNRAEAYAGLYWVGMLGPGGKDFGEGEKFNKSKEKTGPGKKNQKRSKSQERTGGEGSQET